MALYLIANGAMQTTAALPKVTTGIAIKTLLQVKPLVPVRLVEWGYSFDGSAAATGIEVECIETDVAATVTAYVANDINKLDALALLAGDPTTYFFSVGTSASGFTASAEGTPAAVRNLDSPQLTQPTNGIIKQYPLGRESIIQAAKFGRIRVTAGAAVSAYAYMILEG